MVADVGTEAGVQTVIETIPDLDVLVNNAGIFKPEEFSEISRESWLQFFEVNVLSGVRLTQHYLPKMIAKNAGRVIFVSSESAINIPVEMVHYGMTKTAQLAVARGAAETTKGTRVTVNTVMPGPTMSDGVGTFVKELKMSEKDFIEKGRPSSLAQRFAQPKKSRVASGWRRDKDSFLNSEL